MTSLKPGDRLSTLTNKDICKKILKCVQQSADVNYPVSVIDLCCIYTILSARMSPDIAPSAFAGLRYRPIYYRDNEQQLGVVRKCQHYQKCNTEYSESKGKGMDLYSAVSSPLDGSKRFTLSSPDRPVHSDTNSASLGSILSMHQLRND